MWTELSSKSRIVSAQLEGRLYYLVHNPLGDLLQPGARGNEIWIFDAATEAGYWARLKIQACSLKTFTLGNRVRMAVIAPSGVYYMDPDYRMDDFVNELGLVEQRPIPWFFETNTQGANRAHDAWAHLQQVGLTTGNFQGKMRYGVRGLTVDGKWHQVEKVFEDQTPFDSDTEVWDVDDMLQVRRDMKEWFFFAGSVDGAYSSGQVSAVQYRYAPISVNVGYEFGSIETFEYGRNVTEGPDGYAINGIPDSYVDYSRP
jgi:hypothetical protein